MGEANPLWVAVGENVKRFREAKGWTQEDAATLLRSDGLDFTRATIAHLERGSRALALDEIGLFRHALGMSLADLLAGESVIVAGKVSMPLSVLRSLLLDPDLQTRPPKRPRRPTVDDELRRQAQSHGVTESVMAQAIACSEHEAERKAARRLDRDPIEVSLSALERYGRCLSAERDSRVERRTDPATPRRSVQAIRGRVTRELLQEMSTDGGKR